MLSVCIGKIIGRFWEKQNHIIAFEGIDNFITIELQCSKRMRPFPGGIMEDKDLLRLKEFIDKEFGLLPKDESMLRVRAPHF